jgi:hypothetical protein
MRVFLSWHGPTSHSIALALREWLPSVIQNIKPWVSSEDIKKGARWSPAIAKELSECRAAVFCMTPDNLESPWMHFEAGAASNTPWSANICTYLFGVTSANIEGAFSQFQATIATSKDDNLRLLKTLNNAQEDAALDEKRLEHAFNTYWPQLDFELKKIRAMKPPAKVQRDLRDIAEETLDIVRDIRMRNSAVDEIKSSKEFATLYEPISKASLNSLIALSTMRPIKNSLYQPTLLDDDSSKNPLIPPKIVKEKAKNS